MDEIDMVLLFKHYLEPADLSWLEGIDRIKREIEKEKEERDNATSDNNN